MDNYARKTLLLRLDKLQKDKASLKTAYDKLIRMPKDSIADGAKSVISEFLDNYESDILKLDEEINSVCEMLTMACGDNCVAPIQCRADLIDLTYVEVAHFASKMHTDYYISTFSSVIDKEIEPYVLFTKAKRNEETLRGGYIYRIVVPAQFFNQYSEEIRAIGAKVDAWKDKIIEPEDGDGS